MKMIQHRSYMNTPYLPMLALNCKETEGADQDRPEERSQDERNGGWGLYRGMSGWSRGI